MDLDARCMHECASAYLHLPWRRCTCDIALVGASGHLRYACMHACLLASKLKHMGPEAHPYINVNPYTQLVTYVAK